MKTHQETQGMPAFSGLTREQLGRESDEWILKCLALENQEDAAREWDAFLEEDTQDPEPFARPELDRAVGEMIRRRRDRQTLHRMGRVARRTVLVAACFLCVLSMSFTTLFCTVDAVRLNVVELVMRTTQAYTSFNLKSLMGDQAPQNVAVSYESCPRPTWVPPGYQPADSYGSEAEFFQMYLREGGGGVCLLRLHVPEHQPFAGYRGLHPGGGQHQRQPGLCLPEVLRSLQGRRLGGLVRRPVPLSDHGAAGRFLPGDAPHGKKRAIAKNSPKTKRQAPCGSAFF